MIAPFDAPEHKLHEYFDSTEFEATKRIKFNIAIYTLNQEITV